MNWSALTKKQQQMVMATVILAVAQIVLMVHFLGWTKPASARGGAARQELVDLETKLEEAQLVLLREQLIQNELQQSIERLDALTLYSPTVSDRYAWAYEYVSHCATQSRVELDSLEEIFFSGDDPSSAAGKPYEIRLSTRCGYNQLVEFLWRLEKNNRLLRVKEVTISAMRDLPQTQQVQLIIQWPPAVTVARGAL